MPAVFSGYSRKYKNILILKIIEQSLCTREILKDNLQNDLKNERGKILKEKEAN